MNGKLLFIFVKKEHIHTKNRNENRSLENLISIETKLHMDWHIWKKPCSKLKTIFTSISIEMQKQNDHNY